MITNQWTAAARRQRLRRRKKSNICRCSFYRWIWLGLFAYVMLFYLYLHWTTTTKDADPAKRLLKEFNALPFPPPSIHTEVWEEVLHPISLYEQNVWHRQKNNNTSLHYMDLPQFWDPLKDKQEEKRSDVRSIGPQSPKRKINIRRYLGNYGQTRMTREQAKAIGTTIAMGDITLETINVMLASFRDGMCRQTITGLFQRAKYPQRLRVTIVDQVMQGEDEPCIPKKEDICRQDKVLCTYQNHIDTLLVDAMYSSGPVWSRHLTYRMYRGEYFALQTDAHIEFTLNWDVNIVNQWKSTNNEMAVITAYPDDVAKFDFDTLQPKLKNLRPIMCDTEISEGKEGMFLQHGQQPLSKPNNGCDLEPLWAAGFSFGRGHFAVNVPYDAYLPHVFQGEESNIGIRAFTYGYDFYAPSSSVVFHYYSAKSKAKYRKGKFWDLSTYNSEMAKCAMKRLNVVIGFTTPDRSSDWLYTVGLPDYGLGNVRTPEQYYRVFGISNTTIQPNLCMFVATSLLNERFGPAVTSMGLNYLHPNLADFAFQDTWPCPDYWWDKECPTTSSSSGEEEEEET